jgi:hypothetical protein
MSYCSVIIKEIGWSIGDAAGNEYERRYGDDTVAEGRTDAHRGHAEAG